MMYDELIEALRCEVDCDDCKYFIDKPVYRCDEWGMRCDAANALETSEKNRMYLFDRVCELEGDNSELKELVPKWISVNERLPEESREYIVYIQMGTGVEVPDFFWKQ